MKLAFEPLNGRSGHDAVWALLADLYRQETGSALPEILRTPRGKPYIKDGTLHFSLSHTGTHAFCCISSRNVGLDAESIHRRVAPGMAEKCLSPRELARCRSARDPDACFLRLWVLKEAYAKLTGRGWGSYLQSTDFDPDHPGIQIIAGHYVAVLEEGEAYAL